MPAPPEFWLCASDFNPFNLFISQVRSHQHDDDDDDDDNNHGDGHNDDDDDNSDDDDNHAAHHEGAVRGDPPRSHGSRAVRGRESVHAADSVLPFRMSRFDSQLTSVRL